MQSTLDGAGMKIAAHGGAIENDGFEIFPAASFSRLTSSVIFPSIGTTSFPAERLAGYSCTGAAAAAHAAAEASETAATTAPAATTASAGAAAPAAAHHGADPPATATTTAIYVTARTAGAGEQENQKDDSEEDPDGCATEFVVLLTDGLDLRGAGEGDAFIVGNIFRELPGGSGDAAVVITTAKERNHEASASPARASLITGSAP